MNARARTFRGGHPMSRPSSALWLRGFVVVVILSFLAGTGFGQWQTASIDRAASRIADHIAPNIERLASARGEIRNLRILLHDDLDARSQGHAGIDPRLLDESQDAVEHALESQLLHPTDGAELERFRAILGAKAVVDHEVALFRADVRRGNFDA